MPPILRCGLLSLSLALVIPPAAAADPDIDAIEREMEELQAEMERLQDRLESAMEAETEPERGFGGLFQKDKEVERDRRDSFGSLFGRKDDELAGRSRRGDRQVHKLIEDPEALREAARDMERALEESDIIESLADLMIAFSEDITVVEDGDSLSLEFGGESIARVETDGDDRMTLRAMGRKLTVEME